MPAKCISKAGECLMMNHMNKNHMEMLLSKYKDIHSPHVKMFCTFYSSTKATNLFPITNIL